jgi:hypothetical protein
MITPPKPTGWLPDYQILRGLLTPEECRVVITAADDISYPGGRIAPDGTLTVDTAFRKCYTAHFAPGDPVYDMIVTKLMPQLDALNEHYQFELFPEVERVIPVINVNRYNDELGRIGQHTDVGGYEGTENCKLSISILLNDDFEGGEFFVFGGRHEFPLKDARPGDLCVFPSFMVHAVRPVTKGVRYTAVIWLRGPRLR